MGRAVADGGRGADGRAADAVVRGGQAAGFPGKGELHLRRDGDAGGEQAGDDVRRADAGI